LATISSARARSRTDLDEIVGLDAQLDGDDGRAEPEAGRWIVDVGVVIGASNAKGDLRSRAGNAKGDRWPRHPGDDLVGLERGLEQTLDEIVGLDAQLDGDDGRAEHEQAAG